MSRGGSVAVLQVVEENWPHEVPEMEVATIYQSLEAWVLKAWFKSQIPQYRNHEGGQYRDGRVLEGAPGDQKSNTKCGVVTKRF